MFLWLGERVGAHCRLAQDTPVFQYLCPYLRSDGYNGVALGTVEDELLGHGSL
uniref:hypothetical protein n=1 Tax=Halogeometricum borinquense TaxID=60847 RepID=UPI000324BB7A|nr:hypothetical protein [Halogeometricum borinquense]